MANYELGQGTLYAYNGGVLNLDTGGLLDVGLLNDFDNLDTTSATVSDRDGVLSADDTDTKVSINGDARTDLEFLAAGDVSVLGLLGVRLDPKDIMFFDADRQTYMCAPEGLPVLGGLVSSLDVEADATFDLGDYTDAILDDGVVDGAGTGEVMPVGYSDADGDFITDGDDIIAGNGGDDVIDGGGGADHVDGRVDGVIDGVDRVEGGGITCYHILFDRHELVFSESIPTESFHPGAQGMNTLERDARAEILALFPGLDGADGPRQPVARPCLKRREALVLAGAIGQ